MNVFEFSAIVEWNWEYNLEGMTDYKRKYTFYADFAIAEYCEVWKNDCGAVEDTYKRVIESWGSSIEAMAEIVLVLNHKIWSYYQNVDSKYLGCNEVWRNHFAELYNKLYRKAVDFVYKKFEGNDKAMRYYYSVTD